MSVKIITEKDFWTCSEGAMPAPFQGTRKSLKKKSGDIYITVSDKATASWIDFGCTKSMILDAIFIAIAVVIVALCIGVTGGAALFAIGAVAGVFGGVIGAVEGGLQCGQKMSSKREWNTAGKANFISQGANIITSEHTMSCPVGGLICYNPNVKSWVKAISMAAVTYACNLFDCAMTGGAIGTIGSALTGLGSLYAGAKASLEQGWKIAGKGAWNFVKKETLIVVDNILGKSFKDIATGVTKDVASAYGKNGTVTKADCGNAITNAITGNVQTVDKVLSGNASAQDYVDFVNFFINQDTAGGKKGKESEGVTTGENGTPSTIADDKTGENNNRPDSTPKSAKVNKESGDFNGAEGSKANGDHSSDNIEASSDNNKANPSVTENNNGEQQTSNEPLSIEENSESKESKNKENLNGKTKSSREGRKKTIGDEADAYSDGGDAHIPVEKIPDGKKNLVNYDELKKGEYPCFLSGTSVYTHEGRRPIESIMQDSFVYSYNFYNDSVELNRVLNVFVNWTNKYYIIKTPHNTIKSTQWHLFWIVGYNSWYSACDLVLGMSLKGYNGDVECIESIEIVYVDNVATYNIEVENVHNFYVGEIFPILVHNKGGESKYGSTIKRDTRIYTVTDTQTGEVVYVGKTTQDVDTRTNQHTNPKRGDHPEWNTKNPDGNLRYEVAVVDNGNWDPFQTAAREQYYIDKYGGVKKLQNKRNEVTKKNYDNQVKQGHNPC